MGTFLVVIPCVLMLIAAIRIASFYFLTFSDIQEYDQASVILTYDQFATLFATAPDRYSVLDWHTIKYKTRDLGYNIFIFFRSYREYRKAAKIVRANSRLRDKREQDKKLNEATMRYIDEIKAHDIPKKEEQTSQNVNGTEFIQTGSKAKYYEEICRMMQPPTGGSAMQDE